ncbi:hypothetical protein L915_12741 [Phytophthora nicotianae]|uniref:Uncharacterized protein n=4 Tax=Phytophthora nicotianae TaxID=4792 RepID=W2R682_PHYN3|nr:hypothetical protein PPTG_21206 [Phytophthora nicotianae INRA-310]ETK81769.1 hypothetical protein L915_12741 [Phytophthora nicotianae]ETN20025.1 hypothetical protein PPTG_21206 [Phytophthora nicotianae INRA-310]
MLPLLEANVNKINWKIYEKNYYLKPWMLPLMLKEGPDQLNQKLICADEEAFLKTDCEELKWCDEDLVQVLLGPIVNRIKKRGREDGMEPKRKRARSF